MELTRREFVKWTLLSGVAVGLAGCAIPPHQALVSQLDMPEYRLPGVARWFATTCGECEGGCGVSVRVMDGRAKKIEGIPEHPVNHGKVCARGHSALQALYNPDRLSSAWQKQGSGLSPVPDQGAVLKALASQMEAARQKPGSLLWMTPPLSGTKGALIAHLAEKTGARLWVLDFPGSTPERVAMKTLTGKPELPYYDLQNADYVVNFGSDFLITGHASVHDSWEYGEFRQGKNRRNIGRGIMISFASRANMTVANGDKWIPCKPGTEGWVALGLGNLLASSFKKGEWPKWASAVPLETICQATGVSQEIFHRVAARLKNARKPLFVAGIENGLYTNGIWSIWMIQALNRLVLGKILSRESDFLIPLPGQKGVNPKSILSTRDALDAMRAGKFESIWVLDGNPRYLFPRKFDFENLFAKARNKVVFTPYMNETALLADWVVPTQTWLEEWGDRRVEAPYGPGGKAMIAYNLQQPVAEVPDWSASVSLADVLLSAAARTDLKNEVPWPDLHALLKSRFKNESVWENLLVRGGVWEKYSLDWEAYSSDSTHPLYPPPALSSEGKAPPGVSAWDSLKKIEAAKAEAPQFSGDGQVLIPFYSSNLGDGSLANRPWMQELPDPLASTVWTTWIELPLSLARKLGVGRGDVVELRSPTGSLKGPVYPNPGLHDDAVAVPVGQGHFSYGQYADNRGVNPLAILDPKWHEDTGEPAWVSTRVTVTKTGEKARMVTLDTRMDRLPVEVLTL